MKTSLQKLTAIVVLICTTSCSTSGAYDILILNGMVYDGTGSDPVAADIAVKGNLIVKIGDLKHAKAGRVIDAHGLAVAPGFIDLHAHIEPIMELSECESHVRQGVTTALGGPDGNSPYPLAAYMDSLQTIGIGMNVGYLVGHNTIRKNIMQLDNRSPTPEELEAMKIQVDAAMKDGAFGISTGLKYLPGTFSEIDEVIALSEVASAYGGIYTSHLREEGLGLFGAVREAIEISEQADIPVILTHHKVIGKPMWGKSKRTLAMVDSAREAGLDIKIDQYPYTASYTGISVLIPGWARAGGQQAFEKRIEDPVWRDRIKKEIVFNIQNDRGGDDLDRIQFAKVAWRPELEGKTLKYWCVESDLPPTPENGAELVIQAQKNGGASCVFHAMDEKDVKRIMRHPQTMIASDGRLVRPGMGHPHPRWYGTFPRVLGHYVREEKTLSLQEAIRKMTQLPAQTMQLKDRGILKEGMKPDIVVFHPETISDQGTFANPHQYPEGVIYVLVNGTITVDNGIFNHKKAGVVLKRS